MSDNRPTGQKGNNQRSSVGEDFPKEQARCRDLLVQYKRIGLPGTFGASIIEATLRKADEAMASGDVVEILKAYQAMTKLE